MLARLAIAFFMLLVVTSCATEPGALTQTKASVQLLRNEARYRLPELMIKTDSETSDVSVACDAGAEVRITANGPFVETEGADSAEVEWLERQY